MDRWKITSDTKTQGKITKTISADCYMDALGIMDSIVDELDGEIPSFEDLPLTLTFDELISEFYGRVVNYYDRSGIWKILLGSGWIYTGDEGSEEGRRCGPLQRLDSVYL